MTTAIYKNDACLKHAFAQGHPEHPNRLIEIFKAISGPEFSDLKFVEARKAGVDELQRAHCADYIDSLFSSIPATEDLLNLDPDTIINCHSKDAMLYAAGAVCNAVEDVINGKADNAFCAIRPPGHHAKKDSFGGFCLLNNVAVGAMHALTFSQISKVAVVDFDVHHGDGSQNIFWNEENIHFSSLHEDGIFPFSGFKGEVGEHSNIVNVPLKAGADETELLAAMSGKIFPAIRDFKPDLILVSAGFDSHAADPLGGLILQSASYGKISRLLVDFAAECSEGRLIATLEGGYNTRALGESVSEFIKSMMLTP